MGEQASAGERRERASTSASNKLGTTAKLVEVKLKSAQGFLKEELAGMRGRITEAEGKLARVMKFAKEHQERLLVSELIAQAMERVENADADIQKAAEAELPFLKGIEVLAASEASKAITVCEAAAANGQKNRLVMPDETNDGKTIFCVENSK